MEENKKDKKEAGILLVQIGDQYFECQTNQTITLSFKKGRRRNKGIRR